MQQHRQRNFANKAGGANEQNRFAGQRGPDVEPWLVRVHRVTQLRQLSRGRPVPWHPGGVQAKHFFGIREVAIGGHAGTQKMIVRWMVAHGALTNVGSTKALKRDVAVPCADDASPRCWLLNVGDNHGRVMHHRDLRAAPHGALRHRNGFGHRARGFPT